MNKFVDELKEAGVRTRCLILFGSYARGNFTEGSDIDLCVVADGLPNDELERRMLTRFRRPHGIQALAYAPQEFLGMMRSLNPLVLDVVHEGVVLFDDGFVKGAKELLEELKVKHELIKEEGGWRWRVEARQRKAAKLP